MNPEFERNLTLEFSYARLIGMPFVLLIVFALTYLMNQDQFDDDTANIALGLYVFIVLFWGAKQAAESIADELRNHTWDIQKTSAISPWSLSWGKLFGSTLFNWYGGLLCLLVYAATTLKTESIIIVIGYAIGIGLWVHSLSLLMSLFALRKKQPFNSSIGYLLVLFLLPSIFGTLFSSGHISSEIVYWYDFEINRQIFGLISLALAWGWSVIGIYRMLAQELQIRTLPWVWLLFTFFLIIYCHGIISGNSQPIYQSHSYNYNVTEHNYFMLISFAICSFLAYSLIFMDDNNPMLMRRLWIYAQTEKWQRFLEEIPCWFISLILVLPACIYLTLLSPLEIEGKLHFYPIPAFLLMLRDIGLVLFFNYAANPKRALGLSVLYLTFLYWIIPLIFIETGADIIAALFLPLFADNLGLAILFAGAQAGFMGYLLFDRWQKTVNQVQNCT